MKSITFLFCIIVNAFTACSDSTVKIANRSGTLIGYINHTSNNWTSSSPLILEIIGDGKHINIEDPGIGEFRFDNIPEGEYLINYYYKERPDSSMQRRITIHPNMASFVRINAYCGLSFDISPLQNLNIPKKELDEPGAIIGKLHMQDIVNTRVYEESFKNHSPTPKVRFYKRQIKPGEKNVLWSKVLSTTPNSNIEYSLDSVPPGFYQAQVELDPFSSDEIFGIIVLPNKASIVHFDSFRPMNLISPYNECEQLPYIIWDQKYR